MSTPIDNFQNISLDITRTGKGEYIDGRFVPGAETIFSIIASIQNATPDETTMFMEGRRGGEMKVVYTETELRAPNESIAQTKGDIFNYKGVDWEVHKVEDWSDMTDLPHYKCICLKRDDQEGADRG